jgi:putative oxidoreductase
MDFVRRLCAPVGKESDWVTFGRIRRAQFTREACSQHRLLTSSIAQLKWHRKEPKSKESAMMSDLGELRLAWEPRVLSILRIMVALLYLQHGLNKLFDFPATPNHAPYQLMTLVPGVAGLLEVVGSLLLLIGLFTRPVAFLLSGEMAIAYFTAHQPRGFFPYLNGGSLAVLYCFTFFYLFVAGGGQWSFDRMWREPRVAISKL